MMKNNDTNQCKKYVRGEKGWVRTVSNLVMEIRERAIPLRVINGGIRKKKSVKCNLDGSAKRTRSNKKKGDASEVYAFRTDAEITSMISIFNKHINESEHPFQEKINRRNKMLFILGINIGIRGSDLCGLKWNDIFHENGMFKEGKKIMPQKTASKGKYVLLVYNGAVKKTISDYVSLYPITDMNDYIFKSLKGGSISRMSAGRIIKEIANECEIIQNINSHSLRKTFGYQHYIKATDKSAAVILLQKIFNHDSQHTTLKYIGIEQEDLEEFYNEMELGLEL